MKPKRKIVLEEMKALKKRTRPQNRLICQNWEREKEKEKLVGCK